MQTLILPGYSESNKVWVDETAKNLKVEGTIRPFYWMHWTDPNSKFDVQEKAELIAKHLRGEKANIVAKSIGTLVASLVIQMTSDQINKVIFCGVPLNDISSEETEIIKLVAKSLGDRIIIFQNINDPHGSFEDMKDFNNVKMANREDHNYPFFTEFNKIL